jgi:hypothetical protein
MVQWKDGKLYVVYPEKAAAQEAVIPKPDF